LTSRDTLIRNTFWYGVVTFIGIAVGIVMSVVLARGLGPTRMGEFSYVLWATRTLAALATLGFAVSTVRYTASALAQGDRPLAWGIVRLMRRQQIVVTLLVVAVTLPLVHLFAPESMRWALVVMALGLFPLTMEHISSNAVYGANRYDLTAQTSTIKMTLQLGAAIAALALGFDILGLAVGHMAGTLVSSTIQARRAQSIYPREPAPVPAEMQREIRAYLIPLSVVVVLDMLVWDRSEIFFLRLWVDPHEIAFYSLAFGLATKAMIVGEISTGALLPTFAALHGRQALEEFRHVYRTALRNVILVGMPVAALLGALGPGIVTFLYGEEYLPVAVLLSVMITVYTFTATRKVAWAALRGLGDRRCAVTATSVAAAVNIGAAIVFVPIFGTWGAVLGNTLAQLVATVIAFSVLSHLHRCRVPLFDFARITVAGVLAFGAAYGTAGDQGNLARVVFAGVVGLGTYAAAVIGQGVVGTREWRELASILERLRARRRAQAVKPPPAAPVKPAPTEV
jgi:O-antigen/teichoic acid export membrane protein